MKIKAWILIILILMVIITGSLIIKIKTDNIPDVAIEKARKMLAEAELEKSPVFAKRYYQEAFMLYDSAMIEWKYQNSRIIFFRNFEKVNDLAQRSCECSKSAITAAKKSISNTKNTLKSRIDVLDKKLENLEGILKNFPISKKHSDELARCRIIYSESLHAYKNKNYGICKPKLDSIEHVIDNILNYYHGKLVSYFKEYPKWSEQVKQTINHSKRNRSYAIVVDKFARELFIYKKGERHKHFSVELGANWVGDKQQQGDKTTPEGHYSITDRKQNGQTKYYKALLLNYPNEEDKKRFELNKRNGVIKKGAKIGNLIEIHGSGGKGIDWTDGCIALKDTDMDVIFKLCPVGTRVTIVGSTQTFEELSSAVR